MKLKGNEGREEGRGRERKEERVFRKLLCYGDFAVRVFLTAAVRPAARRDLALTQTSKCERLDG